jgi:hypothetical protein
MPERQAWLLALILLIWAAGRTPPGIVRHVVHRLSVIGASVAIGMWIGCFAVELAGYKLPFEAAFGGFFGWFSWLFIFCLIYNRTKPPPVIPPASNLDAPPDPD